jgi:DNA-binding response OmpR family regulator
MSARGGAIQPGQVRPLGVQAERGYVQVVSPAQVKHEVRKADGGLLRLEPLELPTEFRLLFFFMTHSERVYTRAQLLDEVWGDHVFIEERTVDVHIRRLRAALEPSGHHERVETVRGTGYRFRGA